VATRTYAQYCGLAHALELVGERWALLVIRDLLAGPKRFTDLRRGLPRIPTNVLSARLKQLEQDGIVQRQVLPRPASGVAYELTDYGQELRAPLVCLLMWGMKTLGDPRPEDTISADSLIMGLREFIFRPDAGRGLHATFELHFRGIVIHARVDDGALEIAEGPAANPDLTIETEALRALLAGEARADDVRLSGDAALLDRFVAAFQLP
jgi:DNA-binding HxlR family transcriptional regulator